MACRAEGAGWRVEELKSAPARRDGASARWRLQAALYARMLARIARRARARGAGLPRRSGARPRAGRARLGGDRARAARPRSMLTLARALESAAPQRAAARGAAEAIRFPFPALRPGQAEIVASVERALARARAAAARGRDRAAARPPPSSHPPLRFALANGSAPRRADGQHAPAAPRRRHAAAHRSRPPASRGAAAREVAHVHARRPALPRVDLHRRRRLCGEARRGRARRTRLRRARARAARCDLRARLRGRGLPVRAPARRRARSARHRLRSQLRDRPGGRAARAARSGAAARDDLRRRRGAPASRAGPRRALGVARRRRAARRHRRGRAREQPRCTASCASSARRCALALRDRSRTRAPTPAATGSRTSRPRRPSPSSTARSARSSLRAARTLAGAPAGPAGAALHARLPAPPLRRSGAAAASPASSRWQASRAGARARALLPRPLARARPPVRAAAMR